MASPPWKCSSGPDPFSRCLNEASGRADWPSDNTAPHITPSHHDAITPPRSAARGRATSTMDLSLSLALSLSLGFAVYRKMEGFVLSSSGARAVEEAGAEEDETREESAKLLAHPHCPRAQI
ncbi:unnamed protein product [Pleuronectes platessa]|uniref:Uncharacterized protein n=1 Tax=Pleuronectes platessa TaxID=8262 RepID=A0A9N7YTT4_PLEPL|nr:unnamed protein product [Pleuronectes platessa]